VLLGDVGCKVRGIENPRVVGRIPALGYHSCQTAIYAEDMTEEPASEAINGGANRC